MNKLAVSLLLALPAAGCERLIMLGSDCPEGQCARDEVPDGDDAGSAPEGDEDAASGDSGEPNDGAASDDAKTGPDSERDASIEWLLNLRNAGFERNGGLGGDVLISNYFNGFDPVGFIFAKLNDWHTCRPFSVNSVSNAAGGEDAGAQLTDGDYLSFVLNHTPVRQSLSQPMRAGSTYYLKMDVLASPDHSGEIKIQISGAITDNACVADKEISVIGESAVIAPFRWQQLCMSFTPDKDYNYFMLGPWDDDKSSDNARLRLDNVVQVASCSGNWRDPPRDASVLDAADASADGGAADANN